MITGKGAHFSKPQQLTHLLMKSTLRRSKIKGDVAECKAFSPLQMQKCGLSSCGNLTNALSAPRLCTVMVKAYNLKTLFEKPISAVRCEKASVRSLLSLPLILFPQ
jgi:hypothetical protein